MEQIQMLLGTVFVSIISAPLPSELITIFLSLIQNFHK